MQLIISPNRRTHRKGIVARSSSLAVWLLLFASSAAAQNRPPTVSAAIADLTLRSGENRQIDISSVFSDPDDDSLRYSARSGDARIVSVNLAATTLRVSALARGSAEIRVTAEDDSGATAVDTFVVVVQNGAPTLATAIPEQRLSLAGGALTLTLDSFFSDPDDDNLSYAASGFDAGVVTVRPVANGLELTPVRRGATTVTVAVNDGNGGQLTADFTVMVLNSAPIGTNFPNVSLKIDSLNSSRNQVILIDLAPRFSDPDGDVLQFSASTSDAAVANVIVSGNLLSVVAIGSGTATIGVIASDGNGGQIIEQFDARVGTNRVPVVVNALVDTVLSVGAPALLIGTRGASPVFSDPDGDLVLQSALSRSPEIAVASFVDVQGNTLSVVLAPNPPIGSSATIVVRALDGFGGAATDSFRVEVNYPPVLREDSPLASGILLTNTMQLFDLIAAYVDPEGDAVEVAVQTLQTGLFNAEPTEGRLALSPLGDGSLGLGFLVLTATDARGGSRMDTVRVRVDAAPLIAPAALTQAGEAPDLQIDREIEVESIILDNKAVALASLNFRRGGDPRFLTLEMLPDPVATSQFAATIPAPFVTSRGVEYFIEAIDDDSLVSRQPATGFQTAILSVPEPGARASREQPPGTSAAEYRLVSFPLDIADASPAAILADDFGEYDQTRWRFFDPASGAEYPAIAAIATGKAYWLLAKETGRVIDTGTGNSLDTAAPYRIPLETGWNYIGNPFDFTIPTTRLRFTTRAAELPVLREYTGAWNEKQSAPVTAIEPFHGYALFSEQPDTLLVDASGILAPRGPGPAVVPPSWQVQISARSGQAADLDNFVQVSPDAAAGWDARDAPEPPPVGEYVSLYFPHPEWERAAARYHIDARPEPETGEKWQFSILTNRPGPLELEFAGIRDIPAAQRVVLVDELAGSYRDLREDTTYVYVETGSERARPFHLLTGEAGFVDQSLADFIVIPTEFSLSQNFPNPFNPATTIRFSVPRSENVTLAVYTLLGERVALLLDDAPTDPGAHAIVWDGRKTGGAPASSGLYFYELRAGEVRIVRKMLLVK